jgi:hypothetical protein
MKRLSLPLLVVVCASFAGVCHAADDKAASKKDDADTTQTVGRTDVIGSKEAPSVYNVVPWKDKNVTPPKKEITASVLQEIQNPLDQDELRREIMLQESLGAQ